MLIHSSIERLSLSDFNWFGVILSVVSGDDEAPLLFALSGISTPQLRIDRVLELLT